MTCDIYLFQLAKLEKENASTTVLKKVNPPQEATLPEANSEVTTTKDNSNVLVESAGDSAVKQNVPVLEETSKTTSLQEEESKSNDPSLDEASVTTDEAVATPDGESSKTEIDAANNDQGAINESQPFTVMTSSPSAFRIVSPRCKPPQARSSGAFRIVSPKCRPPVSKRGAEDETVSKPVLGE